MSDAAPVRMGGTNQNDFWMTFRHVVCCKAKRACWQPASVLYVVLLMIVSTWTQLY
jgi:hypothetical protein